MLEIFYERLKRGEASFYPMLCRAVSERVKTRVLSPEESVMIAEWFDRMAAGEEPNAVFCLNRPGRPKGKQKPRKLKPDGKEPDDIDIAWIVRQLKYSHPDLTWQKVYKIVEKRYGVPAGTVRNIYTLNKSILGPMPAWHIAQKLP